MQDLDRSVPAAARQKTAIAVIEPRALMRHSLCRALSKLIASRLSAFESVEEWEKTAQPDTTSLIVYSSPASSKSAELEAVERISQCVADIPFLIISSQEDPNHLVALLDKGVHGFIPTSSSLEFAAGAMRFVLAGGVFVPASSLREASRQTKNVPSEQFTSRQLSVVSAVRMGKPNKTIAYELNMCESTVKLHISNIMRKLRAKNRTHLAYLAHQLLDGSTSGTKSEDQ
jgi:DNA-binding NarL/FixJ family response regulator